PPDPPRVDGDNRALHGSEYDRLAARSGARGLVTDAPPAVRVRGHARRLGQRVLGRAATPYRAGALGMTLPPDVTSTRRRWQLQLSERRILLMLGDAAAIFVAVVLALVIWVIVDGRGLGM